MQKRILAIAFVVLGTILYFWSNQASSKRERLSSVTVYGPSAAGTSVFHELLTRTATPKEIGRRALLQSEIFKDAKSLLLLSPTMILSKRETSLVADFARTGGHVFLSAHNQAVFESLLPLLRVLDLPTKVTKDPQFKNGVPASLTADADYGPFKKGERYTLYSPIRFEDKGNEIQSFVHHARTGKGRVTLQLGLPVISNVLVSREDNRNVAFRLIESAPIFIDEYHHYFSDRTFTDLLARPPFVLTMTGILALLLLFFLFSYSTLSYPKKSADRNTGTGMGFHHLGESLLASVVEKPESDHEALAMHRNYLKNADPRLEPQLRGLVPDRTEPLPKGTFISRARKLVQLHQEWLDRKAGLRL